MSLKITEFSIRWTFSTDTSRTTSETLEFWIEGK